MNNKEQIEVALAEAKSLLVNSRLVEAEKKNGSHPRAIP